MKLTTFKQDKEAAALTQQRKENIALLRVWLEKHPEIPYNDANLLAFEEYMDFTDPLSQADFEFALGNMPASRFARQRVPSEAEQVAEENARRKALPMSDLKKLAFEERPVPQPGALPQWYTPIARKKEIELTAEVLRNSGKRNADLSTADLRFLIRRFGASELNKRLGVQPRPQPGYTKSLKI
jgi:hypothetical protein